MKPSERFEAYLIWGVFILLASLAFLPSSLLRWAGDPGDLRFFGWFMLTGVCLAAIGGIREWAGRGHKKSLLWLLTLPLAVIIYEVCFIVKRLWANLRADLKQIRHPDWFILVLYLLIFYFWMRASKYKEQAEQFKIQLEYACEALKKQQQLAQQMREAIADLRVGEDPVGAMQFVIPEGHPGAGRRVGELLEGLGRSQNARNFIADLDKAWGPELTTAEERRFKGQAELAKIREIQDASRQTGPAQAPTPAAAPAAAQPIPSPRPTDVSDGAPRERVPSRCPHCGAHL